MPRVKCPRCGTIVEHAAGFQPICPSCGYGSDAAAAAPTAAPAAVPPPLSPPSPVPAARPPPSQAAAIVGLVLNIVIWPGLGSLVAGRSEGWAQGFLTLLGVILTVTVLFALVGVPLIIGMWIWGIVSGIQAIQQASPARPAAAMA